MFLMDQAQYTVWPIRDRCPGVRPKIPIIENTVRIFMRDQDIRLFPQESVFRMFPIAVTRYLLRPLSNIWFIR